LICDSISAFINSILSEKVPLMGRIEMKILKMTFVLVFCLGLIQVGFAQPDTLWTKTFGGLNDEECNCVIQTSDGGFALAGYTRSFGAGEEDMYLIRTNASGDTLWTRTYGGSGSDGCNSIIQTNDDGFILAGWTTSFGPENHSYLVRTNHLGQTLWTQTYPGVFLEPLRSGGLFNVIAVSDTEFSLAGMNMSVDSLMTCYLIKITSSGDTLWTRRHSISDTLFAFCMDHIQAMDGSYVLTGLQGLFDPISGDPINKGAFVLKLDSSGDALWTWTVNEDGWEHFYSVVENFDGSFNFGGATGRTNHNWYFLHVRLDSSGNNLWTRKYGEGNCWGKDFIRTFGGDYLLAGYVMEHNDDFYAIKTNSTGDSLWSISFGGDSPDECNSVIQTNNSNYVLAGYTKSFGAGGQDFWMVKTAADPSGIEENNRNNIPIEFTLDQNYPNPFNPTTVISWQLAVGSNVKLSIYNILGQKIQTLLNKPMRLKPVSGRM
jgi:hypothetical protein